MANIVDEIIYDNDDPYRTAYHFQPPQNWMNGPMIYKGIYHLFYQHIPDEADWRLGGLVWGHSTSTDLINWTSQPIALSPTESYEVIGCWSGSTTILPGEKPAILYTGSDIEHNQLQILAFPKDLSDPYLKEWVKVPQNPVMVATPTNNMIDPKDFRDPSTAWQLSDGKWRVLIGTKQGDQGSVALFTSEDFITWTDSGHPFRSAEGTGVWECPDFFPVYVGQSLGVDYNVISGEDVKHVLKLSLFDYRCELYTIGRYDTDKDIYIPDEGSVESPQGLLCDYGKYYASKSFFDSTTNRRILFGWVSEDSTLEDNKKKGWAGIQGIPRTILVDEFGKQLVQWPVTEVATLRRNQVEMTSQVIGGGSRIEITGVTASQADVEISFKIPELEHVQELDPTWTDPQILSSNKETSEKVLGPFGLLTLASTGLEEYTAVFFRNFKGPNKYEVLMCCDQSRSSLNPTTDKPSYKTFVDVDPVNDELSLRILIDRSIVESFGAKGKSCITARVYPTLAINDQAKLYAFNYGTEDIEITKLCAWSMARAQVNL
ncbi:Fructan 6-exohydrolase [Bienertia sinuspersici]